MEENTMALVVGTKDNFKDETAAGTVVVDFYADWCGPCQMVLPVLTELSEEMTDVKFIKVNVDQSPEIASEFGVMGIPALFVLKDGEQKANMAGFQPKEALKAWIESAK